MLNDMGIRNNMILFIDAPTKCKSYIIKSILYRRELVNERGCLILLLQWYVTPISGTKA